MKYTDNSGWKSYPVYNKIPFQCPDLCMYTSESVIPCNKQMNIIKEPESRVRLKDKKKRSIQVIKSFISVPTVPFWGWYAAKVMAPAAVVIPILSSK